MIIINSEANIILKRLGVGLKKFDRVEPLYFSTAEVYGHLQQPGFCGPP